MPISFTRLRVLCILLIGGSLTTSLSGQCAVAVTTIDNFCVPEDSVYITLIPYQGTAPFTYLWSTGATTQTISVALVPSDIYFTVTDASGCVFVDYAHIKEGPYIAEIGGNYFTCGGNPSTLNLLWSRWPPANATYLWSTGATTPTIDISAPGTYSVTVTDPFNGCTQSFETVVDPPSPSLEIVSITPASCGSNTGAININTTGESPPFTYIWSNGATTEDLNNISGGVYSLTVTSNDGCTATISATVPENGNVTIFGSTTPNTSCTSNNGAVNMTPTPPGSYTFLWTNGATTEDLTNVSGGTYTVTVTSSGGCTAVGSFTVANNVSNPNASSSTVPASCGQNNGSINLNVTGGVSPYTFLWSNGSTTEDIANIAAGTYSVTITGSNGCTTISSIAVANNNPIINITGNTTANTSCLAGNGTVDINITPADNYTFNWSTGATIEDITNLSGGTFTVTVTSSAGCSNTAVFTVSNIPSNPNSSVSAMPASCGLNNGAANLSVTGGTSPYSFIWSNGQTSEDLTNLASGTYSVTVTGNNGCTSTSTVTVPNISSITNINGTTTPNTSCTSGNGSINITVTPAGSYTFLWSNGEVNEDIVALTSGIYTVTVSDVSGCTGTSSFNVANNFIYPVSTLIPTAASCGLNNGSIELTVANGGIAPFTFIWSNGSTNEDLANLDAGMYTVTVSGGNGCTYTESVTILNINTSINITQNTTVNTSCLSYNGSIDLTVSPVSTYTFNWSNGSNAEDLFAIAGGVYVVTVTDQSGCSANLSITLDDVPNDPIAFGSTTPATCGQSNGNINLNITGGVSPFTFIWSNGSTTEDLSNIPAGIYTVTITGSNGCATTATATVINSNSIMNVTGNITPNTSCSGANGSIQLSVSPTGTYSFEWSTGNTTQYLTNLAAGQYFVTVTDASGCSSIESYTVPQEANNIFLTDTVSPASCGGSNGNINLNVTGGAAPITFIWSTGAMTEDLVNIVSGTYTVTVSDINGCTSTISSVVPENNSVSQITGSSQPNTSCSQSNGSIDITVIPSGLYNYSWSNGAITQDLSGLAAGIYFVTVTQGADCATVAEFTVTNSNIPFDVVSIVSDNSSCSIPTGSIFISVNPVGNYSYLWSTGETTSSIQNLQGGNYIVTVTNTVGCAISSTFTIQDINPSFEVTGIVTDNTSCQAPNGAIDISLSASGIFSFIWSDGSTGEDLINLSSGTYTVTVTSSGGCTKSLSFVVTNQSSGFLLTGNTSPDVSCGSPNGSIDVTITPAGIYTFQWSNGETTEDLQSLAKGTYRVLVTNSNSCSTSAIFSVEKDTVLTLISSEITNESCNSTNGAIDLNITPGGSLYNWSNGSITEDLVNVDAGIYSVTVTDINNCIAMDTIEVLDTTDSFTTTAILTHDTSCVSISGAIDLEIIPAGAYSFAWSTGDVTEDLQLLAAGGYEVTITDQFNCSITSAFAIDDISAGPAIIDVITSSTCGESNGMIDLSITPPVGNTFAWSTGDTTEDLINLAPGTYTITVTSLDGCQSVADLEVIGQSSTFTISGSVVNDTSCASPTGAIDLTINPPGSYTIMWGDGNSNEDLAGLEGGIYEVFILDSLQCQMTETFTVEDHSAQPFLASVITPESCGEANGAIQLTATPSSGNTFIWSNGDTSDNLQDLSSGSYLVTVTNVSGCAISSEFIVSGSDLLQIDLVSDLTSVSSGGVITTNLTLNVPIEAIESITWSPLSMLSCNGPACLQQIFTLDEATEINVMVMDTFGCMAQASLMLDVDPLYEVYIPNVFSPNSDGSNDRFTIFSNIEVEEVLLLEIYNRWGNLIFSKSNFPPNDPSYGWDGLQNGKLLNPEVFAYRTIVKYSNGEEHAFTGDVTLLK